MGKLYAWLLLDRTNALTGFVRTIGEDWGFRRYFTLLPSLPSPFASPPLPPSFRPPSPPRSSRAAPASTVRRGSRRPPVASPSNSISI